MFSNKTNNVSLNNNFNANNNNYNNNNYISCVNNVNRLTKWRIIRKINKQKDLDIGDINGIIDLKKALFWKNSYLVVPDKYLKDISSSRCREFDIYNIHLYQHNCKLYTEVMKKINNSSLKLQSSPIPLPKFTNLERQYLYFKRNENTNNLQQTMSVLYLIQNGYILVKDLNNLENINGNDNSNSVGDGNGNDRCIYFEAYQAIELAHELSHIRGENLESIFLDNTTSSAPEPSAPEPSAPEPSAPEPSAPEPYILNTELINFETKQYHVKQNTQNTQKLKIKAGKMICQNPEHHDVNDKVNYFSEQNSKC
jgi:hypothetical protein